MLINFYLKSLKVDKFHNIFLSNQIQYCFVFRLSSLINSLMVASSNSFVRECLKKSNHQYYVNNNMQKTLLKNFPTLSPQEWSI
jgi:hypothetical protein